MKKMYNPFKVIIITVLLVLLYPAAFNAKAANYSSTLSDVVVEYYHPTVSFTITSHYQKARELWGKVAAHLAEDYAASVGTDVYAAADGVVKTVSYSASGGNYIVIRHSDGSLTRYLHLSKTLVEENDVVKVGDVIAKAGKSGKVTGPHLHFEIINKDGVKVNPSNYVTRIRANEIRVPTGYVRIKTTAGTVLRFDKDGNLVTANYDPMDPDQVFEIIRYEDKYMFKCLGTGTVIDAANGNSYCSTKLWSYSVNHSAAQLYDIVYNKDFSAYYIISSLSVNQGKDMVLDVSSTRPELIDSRIVLWDRMEPAFGGQVYTFETVSQDEIVKMFTCPLEPTLYITFNVTAAPSRIRYGKCFNIDGSITTSTEDIVKVESFIYGKYDGKQKDYTLDTPKAGTRYLNIRKSNVNYKSDYNKLKRGDYTQTIICYTSSGQSSTWSCDFTIY